MKNIVILGIALIIILVSGGVMLLINSDKPDKELSFEEECILFQTNERQVKEGSPPNRGLFLITFTADSPEEVALSLRREIKSTFSTEYLCFESKDRVFNDFQEDNKDDSIVMDSLNELAENPFGPSLKLVTASIEEHEMIKKYINESEYNDSIDNFAWIQPRQETD